MPERHGSSSREDPGTSKSVLSSVFGFVSRELEAFVANATGSGSSTEPQPTVRRKVKVKKLKANGSSKRRDDGPPPSKKLRTGNAHSSSSASTSQSSRAVPVENGETPVIQLSPRRKGRVSSTGGRTMQEGDNAKDADGFAIPFPKHQLTSPNKGRSTFQSPPPLSKSANGLPRSTMPGSLFARSPTPADYRPSLSSQLAEIDVYNGSQQQNTPTKQQHQPPAKESDKVAEDREAEADVESSPPNRQPRDVRRGVDSKGKSRSRSRSRSRSGSTRRDPTDRSSPPPRQVRFAPGVVSPRPAERSRSQDTESLQPDPALAPPPQEPAEAIQKPKEVEVKVEDDEIVEIPAVEFRASLNDSQRGRSRKSGRADEDPQLPASEEPVPSTSEKGKEKEKETERTPTPDAESDKERIRLLEEEVQRLKDELAQKADESLSFTPPPPPPPPPPPNVFSRVPTTRLRQDERDKNGLLGTGRAGLQSTPPLRRTAGKSLLPTVPMESMEAFLSELKTAKLRPTGGAAAADASFDLSRSFSSSRGSLANNSVIESGLLTLRAGLKRKRDSQEGPAENGNNPQNDLDNAVRRRFKISSPTQVVHETGPDVGNASLVAANYSRLSRLTNPSQPVSFMAFAGMRIPPTAIASARSVANTSISQSVLSQSILGNLSIPSTSNMTGSSSSTTTRRSSGNGMRTNTSTSDMATPSLCSDTDQDHELEVNGQEVATPPMDLQVEEEVYDYEQPVLSAKAIGKRKMIDSHYDGEADRSLGRAGRARYHINQGGHDRTVDHSAWFASNGTTGQQLLHEELDEEEDQSFASQANISQAPRSFFDPPVRANGRPLPSVVERERRRQSRQTPENSQLMFAPPPTTRAASVPTPDRSATTNPPNPPPNLNPSTNTNAMKRPLPVPGTPSIFSVRIPSSPLPPDDETNAKLSRRPRPPGRTPLRNRTLPSQGEVIPVATSVSPLQSKSEPTRSEAERRGQQNGILDALHDGRDAEGGDEDEDEQDDPLRTSLRQLSVKLPAQPLPKSRIPVTAPSKPSANRLAQRVAPPRGPPTVVDVEDRTLDASALNRAAAQRPAHRPAPQSQSQPQDLPSLFNVQPVTSLSASTTAASRNPVDESRDTTRQPSSPPPSSPTPSQSLIIKTAPLPPLPHPLSPTPQKLTLQKPPAQKPPLRKRENSSLTLDAEIQRLRGADQDYGFETRLVDEFELSGMNDSRLDQMDMTMSLPMSAGMRRGLGGGGGILEGLEEEDASGFYVGVGTRSKKGGFMKGGGAGGRPVVADR